VGHFESFLYEAFFYSGILWCSYGCQNEWKNERRRTKCCSVKKGKLSI
jgi:hypothetical protein